MFDEKEKIRYLSDGIRNIGIAFIAGGCIAAATQEGQLVIDILLISVGIVEFIIGYLLLKD